MFDHWVAACAIDDRKSRIQSMGRSQLERALEWPDTQKTLLPMIRRLLKEKSK